MFFLSNIAALLGFTATHDDPVVDSRFIQLEDMYSKTLEEKKTIVDHWLLTRGINDPIHIDENGQETRFIDWAIGKNDLDFATYLINEKKASCDSQAQHRLQHFITPEMRLIINSAKSDGKARVLTRELWVDTGDPTSRLLSSKTVVAPDKAGFAIKETEQIIPCLQTGRYTAGEPSVIRITEGDVSACADGIHRLAVWIADQFDEYPILSNINRRREVLSELEVKRKTFFDIMYQHSNLSIDFWYEGLKNAFEKKYFLRGRSHEKKKVALSYCTIVDGIKLRLTSKQRYFLLQAINEVTRYSVSSKGIFSKTKDSDYQVLCKSDAQFSDRVVKMKESLQGWSPPEPFVDRFAPPPPPPPDYSNSFSSDH